MANKRFWERFKEQQEAEANKAAATGKPTDPLKPEIDKNNPLYASDEEVQEWIRDYGFRLPEEDPTGGGFVCDYFPNLEEDITLQKRILFNHYRIYELLMAEYVAEQKKKDATLRIIK